MRPLHALVTAPVRGVLAPALYLALGAATVAIVRGEPQFALAGDSATALAVELVAGGLLIAAALAAWRPGSGGAGFAALLVLTALAWPLREWAIPGAGAAFTAGLVLYAAWPALLAAAALRGPDQRSLSRPARLVVASALAASLGVLGLASAAVFDPRAEGCRECPPNRLLVAGASTIRSDLGRVGLGLSAAWAAAFAALAAVRLARTSPARRRLAAPALVPAAVAVALFGTDALHGVARGFVSNDPTDRALWTGEIAALGLVAAGVAWGRVRSTARTLGARPARGRPGRLALRPADCASCSPRRSATRRSSSSTTLEAAKAGSTPTAAPAIVAHGTDREVTPIMAGGRGVSAVVHRRGLLDDPALTAEIAVAARLALEHERLRATQRAHLAALRASRARIVATADAERRRLERDLHDGAQQRLVTLAIGVRLARRRHTADDPGLDRELAAAERELHVAVAELREVAHGLFPAALEEEGLAAAVQALAEREPRLVPGALPATRFPPQVESAAYFLVDEALRLAGDADVAVDAESRDGRLVVDLSASTFAPLPVRVEDRVGAVGGTVIADRARVRAELPCVS